MKINRVSYVGEVKNKVVQYSTMQYHTNNCISYVLGLKDGNANSPEFKYPGSIKAS